MLAGLLSMMGMQVVREPKASDFAGLTGSARARAMKRVGMDFRIRCNGCGHEAWIPRVKLEKSIRRVVESAENDDDNKMP